jgi:AcrR family transcriptional regulator
VTQPTTRDLALAAARRVILEEGLGALSMRRIAKEADVSAPALYRHFDSKEALAWIVVGEGFAFLVQYLSRALAAANPVERFVASGRAYLDFAREKPGYYTLVFGSTMRDLGNDCVPESTRTSGAAAFQMLIDRVRECMDAGVFEEEDARSVALFVWSEVHGLASLRLAGRLAELDDLAFEEERERCLGRIVRALRV